MKWTVGAKIGAGYAAALVAFAVIGTVSYQSIDRLDQTSHSVDRTIIRSGAMEFGILADVIVGTRRVPLDGLQPSLSTLTGVREEYLRGVTTDGTVVLDARRLLADPAIVVHEEPGK